MGPSTVPLVQRGPQIPQAALLRGGSRVGQHRNPFPPGSALGGSAGLGQPGCGFAMLATRASALWVLGPAEEAEDAQACKPGAGTAAKAGPISSWTRVLVPGQHPSKACRAGGCAGLAWEQGLCCCRCSTGSPCWVLHAPDLRSSIASTPLGAEDGGGLTRDTARSWTVRHHVTRVSKVIAGLQPPHRTPPALQVCATGCGRAPGISTRRSQLHGCHHHPCSPPASRTFPPLQGRVSATAALSTGAPSAPRRSRDTSHFARGLAGAWLCCVSVLAVS